MNTRAQKVVSDPPPRLVPTFMLRGFWDEMSKRGITPAELERASGVARPRYGDFRSSAPAHEVHRLFEMALELTGDQTLGLTVGRALNAVSFHLIGHLVLASATLHEAVKLAVRALPALARRPPLLCELANGNVRLGFVEEPSPHMLGARVESQMTGVQLYNVMGHFLQPNVDAPMVQFPFQTPTNVHPYRRCIAGTLQFNAEGTFVVFPKKALVRRRSAADRGLVGRFLQMAQEQYGGFNGGVTWSSRVRYALRLHPAPRVLDLNSLAEQLGVSHRMLARRLAREGVTTTALVEEVLYERAKALLDQPGATATAVAEALGYAELSSFFRAFRRWSGGLTPNGMRKLRSDASE